MNGTSIAELLSELRCMTPGVERDIVLYRWKNTNWPEAGIFSTAHGGDAAGNFIRAMEGEFLWPDIGEFEGKRIVLEFERNFNNFVKWAKAVVAKSD